MASSRSNECKTNVWVVAECMTKSKSSSSLHSLDPEIDKTLNRIRKTKNIHVGNNSSSFNSISKFDMCEYKRDITDNPLYELEPMENNNRILKELVTPNMLYQPWCIQYPQLEPAQSYELKSRLIRLLPKFHGLTGVPRGLFHDEATRDPIRLYQDKGIPIRSRWSNKGLVVPAAGHVRHIGRHEAPVLGEILPSIQDYDHSEGDMWNQATL
ncbi:hypothetical protein CR513_08223, partial [Mucuna pruriens]